MRERVFEKDGNQVSTSTPAQAVRLLAEGYDEITDDPPYQQGDVAPRSPGSITVRAGERVVRHTPPPSRAPSDERNQAPD